MDKYMLTQKLYAHIVKQISDDIENRETSGLSEDQCESLEVAKQCMQTAFGLSDESPIHFEHNLLNVYKTGIMKLTGAKEIPEPSPEEKDKAEKLKAQGNLCMSEKMFTEAVDCYTKAIDLIPNNAVYYCNRAAAYSRLENHNKAIQDCNTALEIDPNYTKAYGRMGSAYTAQNMAKKAMECYQKALELDPNNAIYKSNFDTAKEAAEKATASGSQPGLGRANIQPTLGGLDLGSLLNDPNTMNMVNQMLSNPQMQNVMSSFMSSMNNPGAQPQTPSVETPPTQEGNNSNTPPADMNEILRMGQQLAQQMQQSNPELIDSLRRQHQQGGNPSNQNNNEPPPPSDTS